MKTTAVFVLLLLVCHVSADPEGLMREMAVSLAELKVEMTFLRNQTQGKQVAFSASLSDGGEITLGPFPGHTDLIFKHVLTNIGDAYNPETGVFTAPVKGAYQFECYFTMGGSGLVTAVGLFKNSQLAFAASEHQQGSGFGSAAQGATMLLEAGDVVVVKLWATNKVYDDNNHHTTFSGHMLFPM